MLHAKQLRAHEYGSTAEMSLMFQSASWLKGNLSTLKLAVMTDMSKRRFVQWRSEHETQQLLLKDSEACPEVACGGLR
jgi:hypothetical protein